MLINFYELRWRNEMGIIGTVIAILAVILIGAAWALGLLKLR